MLRYLVPLACFALMSMSVTGCGQQPTPSASTTSTTTAANQTITGTRSASTTAQTVVTGCLCVFDVDRTLTGKQDDMQDCPQNQVFKGVRDTSYPKGDLTLSELGQGIARTFCQSCYLGIVSAGSVGGDGSSERSVMLKHINSSQRLANDDWSHPHSETYRVTSPLVIQCREGHKQRAVRGIVDWYMQSNIEIRSKDVYFFDDRQDNILPFKGSGFNARQVSCQTRDPAVAGSGLCGATPGEIVPTTGVFMCSSSRNSKDVLVI